MMTFYRVFAELCKNGMVEQIESWPYPMFAASKTCPQKAFDLWKQHGYKPMWLAPGRVGLKN
jgi:hypothetical protein